MLYNQFYPFEVMALPYEYDALEPDISRFTMFFHYNEHYLPAVEKLNNMVQNVPYRQNCSLEQLTKSDDTALQHLAGNVFTHEMHFTSLTDKRSALSEHLRQRIERDYGTVENLLDEMKKAATKVYGSGYVWLVINHAGILEIVITPNHETPDLRIYKPVYTLDLWEHGYYIDCQNHRDDYVDAAFRHINWEQIEENIRDRSLC